MRYNKTKLEIDAVYNDQSSRFLSVYEQINSKRIRQLLSGDM